MNEELSVAEQAAKEMPPAKEITVTLGDDSKVTVKKLKASNYYEAQKYYVEWLHALEVLQSAAAITTKQRTDSSVADTERTKAAMQVAEGASDVSVAAFKVVAASLGVTPEQLGELYYPEDIQAIFDATTKVNNFMQNLTKSVTPTAGIGV